MTTYESMLSAYRDADGTATPNAEQEVCQKITLAGLRHMIRGMNKFAGAEA